MLSKIYFLNNCNISLYFFKSIYNIMPAPVKITLQNITYTVPILDGNMDAIAQAIQLKKDEILSLNSQLSDAIATLNDLNRQFMSAYIVINGGFPP
jgi:hypothetical protein